MGYLIVFLGLWVIVAVIGLLKKLSPIVSIGGGFIIGLVGILIIASIFKGDFQTNSQQSYEVSPQKTPAPLPKYEIVKQNKHDTPLKTQIEINAVVSDQTTEIDLKRLLNSLYTKASNTGGFKYHGGKPTHVFIYLYSSRQHFKSGMGQWLAMLKKVGKNSEKDIMIRKENLNISDIKPQTKFGLTEKQRKEVYSKLFSAEDKANIQAMKKFPLEPTRALEVGQVFQLTDETPLMPELEPSDPMNALSKMRRLPAGVWIKIDKVAKKKTNPWYQVRARDSQGNAVGSGWINSTALIGQGKIDTTQQMQRQADMQESLKNKYDGEIAEEYGLNKEQLSEILVEGTKKNWPIPEMKLE